MALAAFLVRDGIAYRVDHSTLELRVPKSPEAIALDGFRRVWGLRHRLCLGDSRQ